MATRKTRPPGPPPNIYIVGAQCTGKTTLVSNLRQHFARQQGDEDGGHDVPPPVIISEVARTVLSRHRFTARDVRSPARSLALQQLILNAQAAAERRALGRADGGCAGTGGAWFVSDRSGADPVAYALRYVGAEETRALTGSAEWIEMRRRMRNGAVVVCEAGPAAAAWLTDDGVRLMPVDLDEWVGFHRLFCEFLDREGVGYAVLPAELARHEERVAFVLARWREKWAAQKGA